MQDIGKLVHDGVPSDRLYGTDLHLGFLELGYELSGNRDTWAAHYVARDLFQYGKEWDRVREELDIIHVSSIFHIFGWND